MILKIVQAGDPALRTSAKRFTRPQLAAARTQQLIELMVATLRDRPGVGLAASQVGESLPLVIIEDKPDYLKRVPKRILQAQGREAVPLMVLANPSLEVLDPAPQYFFEGCLSLSGYRMVVPRASRVKVTYWDRGGAARELTTDGWLARILQHEIGHLHGSLCIDHMLARTFISEETFQKDWAKATQARLKRLVDEALQDR